MSDNPPLVIDLDGTLLRSDLLYETFLLHLRDRPLRLLAPLFWLKNGKAALKEGLARATSIDVSVLPYDDAVLELISGARSGGRRVVLATASHRLLADQVADHLGIFDEVIATEGDRNLSADVKRETLVTRYGESGFDYAGNSRDDLPVWRAARHAYVVNASAAVAGMAQANGNVVQTMQAQSRSGVDWAKAMRWHQWLKNVLIFLPLLAAHKFYDQRTIFQALVAFVCFGMCASSVYLLNDLLDLGDDRHHKRKRTRPFAAGRLPIRSGLILFPVLLVLAFGVSSWLLRPLFGVGLLGYYVMTLGYSMWLKRKMVVDVITLAALYTIRIIAGAIALDIPLSFWLLAFSMFMFLSLALMKRYTELLVLRTNGTQAKIRGRGYVADDLAMLASMGAAAGYMAVMVLALYINDPGTVQLYRHPKAIWLACPLLLAWISRTWMLAHHGRMHDDPVVFAVRDRISLGIGALIGLAFWAAL